MTEIGRTFNLWTVIREAHSGYWWCRCACGTERAVSKNHVKRGDSKSCGCLSHGKSKVRRKPANRYMTPEFLAWSDMKGRCLNPKVPRYPQYGGRGIQVCVAWLNSFDVFLEDVGPKPGPQFSLERLDNDGNYEPKNVVWAEQHQQARNRTTSRRLTIGKDTHTLAEWSEISGVHAETINSRIECGWSLEAAITGCSGRANCPCGKHGPKPKRRPIGQKFSYNGESLTVKEWAKRVGINYITFNTRLLNGWSIAEAIESPLNGKAK